MPTVREELARIQHDTDALVSLAESGTDISREVSGDVSRLAGEVQLALREQSHATAEYVEQLDHRLRDVRDRVVAAIDAAGQLLYRGQQEQADQLSRAVVGGSLVGGLFSLLGTAIAGKLVSGAIHDAAASRPPTPDERLS